MESGTIGYIQIYVYAKLKKNCKLGFAGYFSYIADFVTISSYPVCFPDSEKVVNNMCIVLKHNTGVIQNMYY